MVTKRCLLLFNIIIIIIIKMFISQINRGACTLHP